MKRTLFSHTFGAFFIALKRNIDAAVFVTKQGKEYLVEFRTNKAFHCLRLSGLVDYELFIRRMDKIQKPYFKVGFDG